jgi:hypothetical protein
VELAPLAPGHAHNRTDARIAHMNTFLKYYKAFTRVFGAIGMSKAFHAQSIAKRGKKKKLLALSHIYHRVVTVNKEEAKDKRKNFGAFVHAATLDNMHMGVKGFLYFDFSVLDEHGTTYYPVGYARVREHADPDRHDNPTYVYTWRKDFEALMCQACSDRQGGPVNLAVFKCTKAKCAVDHAERVVKESAAAARVLSSEYMPLELPGQAAAAVNPIKQAKKNKNSALQPNKNKAPQPNMIQSDEANNANAPQPQMIQSDEANNDKAPQQPNEANKDGDGDNTRQPDVVQDAGIQWQSTTVYKQVRAVHGEASDGKTEIWLYIPDETTQCVSSGKRRGWWLYAEPGKQGYYYIGPLTDIQKTKSNTVADVATFPAVPFLRRVQVKPCGQEMLKTLRCVTTQALSKAELTAARNGENIEEPQQRNHGDAVDDERGASKENKQGEQQPAAPLTPYEAQRAANVASNAAALLRLGVDKGRRDCAMSASPLKKKSKKNQSEDDDEAYGDESDEDDSDEDDSDKDDDADECKKKKKNRRRQPTKPAGVKRRSGRIEASQQLPL